MRVTCSALWLPKAGHSEAEYEDAFGLPEGSTPPLRIAVADGATESAFAGDWARRLAHGFVAEGAAEPAAFRRRLAGWQRSWQAAAAARSRDLPWYAAAKAEEGAFAAFLGLELLPDGAFRALAVGDCCLLHLGDGGLQRAWPLDAPEAFHHRPALLPSRPAHRPPEPSTLAGTWRAGEAFVLATDALAAWLLGGTPEAVRTLAPETFREAVDAARAGGALRNDDVTAVLVERIA